MTNIRPTLLTLALLTVGTSGCATRRSIAPGDSTRAPVELVVDNRNSTNSSITVYVVREGTREKHRLGTVRLAEKKSFKFLEYFSGARYRFVARETGGQEWASDAFLITPGDLAEWRTHRGIVWVGEPARGGL
jgi:hypothetical protein